MKDTERRAALDACYAVLARRVGDRVHRDAPLGPRTTYRVGGRAGLLLEASSPEDVAAAGESVRASGVPVLVVGNGSNLLVADRGFPGLAVALGAGLAGIEIDVTVVHAGGAALLPVVARRSVAAGLTGFEWAVGVPGSIGGAVRMNAGGHGSDMAASLVSIRAVDLQDGEDVDVAAASLDLGYRRSNIGPATVVVSATLQLEPGSREGGQRLIEEIVRWRRENQPGGSNAGSVFTNPPGDSAGRLVDAAGCKGLRIGSAVVSDKHANFVLADSGGSADDVHALMQEVRRRVHDASGVDLRPETVLVGFDAPERANSQVEVES